MEKKPKKSTNYEISIPSHFSALFVYTRYQKHININNSNSVFVVLVLLYELPVMYMSGYGLIDSGLNTWK